MSNGAFSEQPALVVNMACFVVAFFGVARVLRVLFVVDLRFLGLRIFGVHVTAVGARHYGRKGRWAYCFYFRAWLFFEFGRYSLARRQTFLSRRDLIPPLSKPPGTTLPLLAPTTLFSFSSQMCNGQQAYGSMSAIPLLLFHAANVGSK